MESPAPPLIEVGGVSHAGRVRQVNEDAALVSDTVLVVADGMGGHDAGDLASAAVVESFRPLTAYRWLERADVEAAIDSAHRAVRSIAARPGAAAGSTLAGAVACLVGGEPSWLVFHVGDSRVYRFDGERLERLTVDHSVVQEKVDAGELTPAQAEAYPGKNVITRAVGLSSPETGPYAADFSVRSMLSGDVLLVCSDGLTREVPDGGIEAVLRAQPDPQEAAQALVDKAVQAGGRDNVTAVVAVVIEGGPVHDVDETTAPATRGGAS
ncbi:PP2C family protein-serine/threonine phosphatase [Xylanimonas allomyrinae]|uniref:PP2C family protein-serine/threonine phosphatase n=1 Tax=Xylanimonas allomyrinae TaxID=2509459 RepID=UPI0013A64D79|nr:protein phosphatase 2C domain-containing protein [Xylanimonas allomyrinae]